jgi:hypothetical protein
VLAVKTLRAAAGDVLGESRCARVLTAVLRAAAAALGNPAPRSTLMNTSAHIATRPIRAHQVSDDTRLHTLTRHFGIHMLALEDSVYYFMRQLAKDYRGGYWHFYELSNGGFYMRRNASPSSLP